MKPPTCSRRAPGPLAIVVALTAATAAADEKITHTVHVPPDFLPFNQTVSVPGFDPALGVLLDVQVELVATFTASVGIENLSNSTGTGSVLVSSLSLLEAPITSGNFLSATPKDTIPVLAAPYDGTTDYAGTSGAVLQNVSGTASATLSLGPAPAFAGVASVSMAYSASDLSAIPSGNVNLDASARGSGSAQIRVTYGFDPAPDCDRDGIPDSGEPDCDGDGTPDDCEPDCDGDGDPDDCELDSDGDGHPDDCDTDVDGVPPYNRPGSLLVYPEYDNTEGVQNLLTVTNTSTSGGNIDVHFNYVDETDCSRTDVTDTLTPADTLTVMAIFHSFTQDRGYAYAYAEVLGEAVAHDYLTGNLLTVDGIHSISWSVGAVSYRAIGPDGAATDVDADGIRDLNGIEYEPSPDELLFPRFMGSGPIFEDELILINLTGGAAFQASAEIRIYNDNEELFSMPFVFSCASRTPLATISVFFTQNFLANISNQDPGEIVGFPSQEAGWFSVHGVEAVSPTTTITDPALLGVLIDRTGTRWAGTQPFYSGTQDNGDLLPFAQGGDPTLR